MSCRSIRAQPRRTFGNPLSTMGQFLAGRRPTPALAVAFVALLAALSGTAVALPGENTVDSADIKNNAVGSEDIKHGTLTSADLRNNGVHSRDVRDNTLRGADINESRLGTVPNANSANTATRANTANSANTASSANTADRAGSAGSVDGRTPFLVKLSAGESQVLATHGAVSIVADCIDDGATDVVRILGATIQDGAAQGAHDNEYSGAAGDTLDVSTAVDDRVMWTNSAAEGTTNVDWEIDHGWVMAPDGKTLGLDGETTPLGLNYAGAECVVSGVVNASG